MVTATFTDPQGQTWTNAVIKAVNFSLVSNVLKERTHGTSEVFSYTDELDSYYDIHTQFAYWANQASLDANNPPYILSRESASPPSNWFWFSSEGVAPIDLDAIELACESYLVTHIL